MPAVKRIAEAVNKKNVLDSPQYMIAKSEEKRQKTEVKFMKRILLTLLLCMLLAVTMTTNAFAIGFDCDRILIPNDGTYEDITLGYDKDCALSINTSNHIWYDLIETGEEGKVIVRLYANDYTDVGTGIAEAIEVDKQDGVDAAAYVTVYDNSRPEILKAVKSGSKVQLQWEGGLSFYYQVQYRVKGGTWKTAARKYDIRPKLQTAGQAYTFKSLKKGTTYQFRVRPVTPSYEWGNVYGKWSSTFTYKMK